jgi:hypothetical protein
MPASRYAIYEPPEPGLPWLAVRFFSSEIYVVPAENRTGAERVVAAQRELYSAYGSESENEPIIKVISSKDRH